MKVTINKTVKSFRNGLENSTLPLTATVAFIAAISFFFFSTIVSVVCFSDAFVIVAENGVTSGNNYAITMVVAAALFFTFCAIVGFIVAVVAVVASGDTVAAALGFTVTYITGATVAWAVAAAFGGSFVVSCTVGVVVGSIAASTVGTTLGKMEV